ncbi:hypothetical protein V6N11_018323 [Hibiscus sabdariffa]|uniref:Polygalacturonase n=1 Tax=Hibiscus sabdariffa TaxID=183260 RepID=A0ABR2T7K9_9ROSI
MKFVFGFTVFLLTGFALGNELFSEEASSSSSSFDVMNYGAVGNGKADDSQAFNKTWEAVCSAQVGDGIATLVVPQGTTFLLNPIKFQGPCQAKSIHFQLGGTLIAPQSTSWGDGEVTVWIQFSSVENLILDGGGAIDGQGSIWWEPCMKTSSFGFYFDCNRRPRALNFHDCNGLQLKGLTHLNSPRSHISINDCKNVFVSDIHIKAPGDSPNTDGIDISRSTNVQIQDSTIGTGDDCVAINGGSSFINITGVNCGPGHGIRIDSVCSVGSLGDGDYDTVEELHVKNCNFSNTQNGGKSGFARKISFEHIFFNNVQNPIIINQFYQDKGRLLSHGILPEAAAIQVSDVTYSDIEGTSASDRAIGLDCDNVVGCSNIVMNNVQIKTSGNSLKIYGSCNNAHGSASNVEPEVPCLS